MDSPSLPSPGSPLFIPPLRPVLSACLLAALLLLSPPAQASAPTTSLAPSPTPPPAFFGSPSQPTGSPHLASIPIQHSFGELDWADEEEGGSASSRDEPVDRPPPAHLALLRRQPGQSQSRRLKRQDDQSESAQATPTNDGAQQDGQATVSASEVQVADVPSSVATDGLVASTTAQQVTATTASSPQSTSTSTGKIAPPVPTGQPTVRNPLYVFERRQSPSLASPLNSPFLLHLLQPSAVRPDAHPQPLSRLPRLLLLLSLLPDLPIVSPLLVPPVVLLGLLDPRLSRQPHRHQRARPGDAGCWR